MTKSIFSRKTLSLITLLFALTGCIGEVPSRHLVDAPEGVTPELQLAPKLPPYRLQVGDVVNVKLMLNPELTTRSWYAPTVKFQL